MTPKSIAQLWVELNGPTSFRVRDINTLEDFVTCYKYEWKCENGVPVLVALEAADNMEKSMIKIDANEKRFALLSTLPEIKKYTEMPPSTCVYFVKGEYRKAKEKIAKEARQPVHSTYEHDYS
jgi:hypothetical protein